MTYYNNGYERKPFDWLRIVHQDQFLADFIALLMAERGQFLSDLPKLRDNPVTVALANNRFLVEEMTERFGKDFNRTSVSKAATICQMVVFNNQRGPERDNKPKALRRHWYAWYKTKFALPFAYQLGDYEVSASGVIIYNDLAWSQRLSQTYAWFVDNARYTQDNTCPKCGTQGTLTVFSAKNAECSWCNWQGKLVKRTCTYRDLWVEDASRMISRTNGELFRNANIIVAVEKDSLFDDFKTAAHALGATAVISGKGKSSKAAIEKLLRDVFNWTDELRFDWDGNLRPPVFAADRPLHVIHVSDHDFDGQAVIGPTFGEQLRRYTPYVKEARVGIKPEDLTDKGYDPAEQMYSVKLSNKGYINWAKDQALFLAECANCGHRAVTKGTVDYSDERISGDWPNACPHCGGPFLTLHVQKKGLPAGRDVDIAYGLEVEAMTSSDYRDLLVKALLTIIDFDYIVERLRLETIAFDQYAAERIRDNLLADNDDYQRLLAEFEVLERKKRRFENAIMTSIWPVTAAQANAYPHQGDDPAEQDYADHVQMGGWGAWRPFSTDIRTDWLVEDFETHQTGIIDAWKAEDVDDYDVDDFDYVDVSNS